METEDSESEGSRTAAAVALLLILAAALLVGFAFGSLFAVLGLVGLAVEGIFVLAWLFRRLRKLGEDEPPRLPG